MLKTKLDNRIYGLDVMRAFAIISVLFYHICPYFPHSSEKYIIAIFKHGVPIFFILSGFLIGQILLRTIYDNKFSLFQLFKFWCNRWIRTIPPYYITLTAILVLTYSLNHDLWPAHLTNGQIAKYYLFIQNFWTPRLPFFIESWSLSIEEWFYIITPSLIFITLNIYKVKKAQKAVLISTTVVFIFVIGIRLYRYMIGVEYDEYQVINRLDSLMFGVIGAYIFKFHNTLWNSKKNILFIIGIVLFSVIILKELFIEGFGYYKGSGAIIFYNSVINDTFVAIVILLFVPQLNSIKKGTGITYKCLTYTSLISYSLYLINYTPVKYGIIEYFSRHYYKLGNTSKIAIFLIISYMIASIMYLFIEKPCMDIRKKIKFLQK